MAGAAGSNECPAGSARIVTEAACRTAVAAAGKFPGTPFRVLLTAEPGGCNFFTRSNIAYFNGVGVAGNPNAQLLCAAVASAGAPPHAAGGRCRWPPRAHAGSAQRHCRACAALARARFVPLARLACFCGRHRSGGKGRALKLCSGCGGL